MGKQPHGKLKNTADLPEVKCRTCGATHAGNVLDEALENGSLGSRMHDVD